MIRTSILLIALLLECVCNAGESLRFQFQSGDKFSLVSVTEQKAAQPRPESDSGEQAGEPRYSSGLRLRCDLDVEEVEQDPDGVYQGAWAKYTYRQVALKISGKDEEVDYDSDANQLPTGRDRRAGIPSQVLTFYLALGESFFVRITPQGRIDRINGLTAVVGNAKSKIPNIAVKDQIMQAIDQQFAEDKIRRALEDQLAVFPDANSGPVDIGQAWSQKQFVNEGKITSDRAFRLKERRDGVVIVDVNVIVGSDANEPPISVEGLKAKREVSGQGTGQIEIEESTGRIINSTLTQDVIEKITFLPEGAIRRPPPAPAPARTHIVMTFQMIKRDSDMALPEPNKP